MNICRGIGLAAYALLSASAGAAQIPTSTHDIVPRSSAPTRSEVVLTDQVFRDLVACVIGRDPGRSRNLLTTIPGTRDEAIIVSSFESRMEHCYDDFRTGGRALAFQANLFRGVVAEAYFARDFPGGIAPADAAPELTAAWTQPRPIDGEVGQMEMLHATARCVTARQPATVNAMIRAAPFSPEERAAMRALQPDLSACLDRGIEFAASRQSLRALLAEAAFHYAEAQRRGFARAETAQRD